MSEAVRPSVVGYVVAAAILIAVLGGAGVLIAGFGEATGGLLDLTFQEGAGEFVVEIHRPGVYGIHAEHEPVAVRPERSEPLGAHPALELALEVRSEDGTLLSLGDAVATHFSLRRRQYLPLATFEAPRKGRVVVRAAWPQDMEPQAVSLVVAPNASGRTFLHAFGRLAAAIGLIVLGGGAALVVFLVTLVRRGGAARQRADARPGPRPPLPRSPMATPSPDELEAFGTVRPSRGWYGVGVALFLCGVLIGMAFFFDHVFTRHDLVEPSSPGISTRETRPEPFGFPRGQLLAMGVTWILEGAGVTVFLVTLVKRTKAKRRIEDAAIEEMLADRRADR